MIVKSKKRIFSVEVNSWYEIEHVVRVNILIWFMICYSKNFLNHDHKVLWFIISLLSAEENLITL